MLRRFFLIFTIAFTLCGQSAAPAKHPDFSGRWRMLKDQSDFGRFNRPDIIVRIVDHHEPTLNVHTVQTTGSKTTTSDVSYFTDGSETTNVMSGRDATSKAFWDGSALVIRTTTTDSKNETIQYVDHWELAADGQILTITSDITAAAGEAHLKLVCEKEKVGG